MNKTKTAKNIALDIQRSLARTGQHLTAENKHPVPPKFTQAYKLVGLAIAMGLVVAAVVVFQDYAAVALASVLAAGVSKLAYKLNAIENRARAEEAKSALFKDGALAIKCQALVQTLNLRSVDDIDEELIARLVAE